jgi:hypothetical protein
MVSVPTIWSLEFRAPPPRLLRPLGTLRHLTEPRTMHTAPNPEPRFVDCTDADADADAETERLAANTSNRYFTCICLSEKKRHIFCF